MKRMIGSWLTSGRSMKRSIKKAMAIIASAATRKDAQIGRPRSSKPTKVSAAKSTMVPCAKLNTPDAL